MATAKKTKTTTKKPAAAPKEELRVLAWRVQPDQFDVMAAACQRLKITKTTLLNEGIALALALRGEAKAAEKFKA